MIIWSTSPFVSRIGIKVKNYIIFLNRSSLSSFCLSGIVPLFVTCALKKYSARLSNIIAVLAILAGQSFSHFTVNHKHLLFISITLFSHTIIVIIAVIFSFAECAFFVYHQYSETGTKSEQTWTKNSYSGWNSIWICDCLSNCLDEQKVM